MDDSKKFSLQIKRNELHLENKLRKSLILSLATSRVSFKMIKTPVIYPTNGHEATKREVTAILSEFHSAELECSANRLIGEPRNEGVPYFFVLNDPRLHRYRHCYLNRRVTPTLPNRSL